MNKEEIKTDMEKQLAKISQIANLLYITDAEKALELTKVIAAMNFDVKMLDIYLTNRFKFNN